MLSRQQAASHHPEHDRPIARAFDVPTYSLSARNDVVAAGKMDKLATGYTEEVTRGICICELGLRVMNLAYVYSTSADDMKKVIAHGDDID